MANLILRGIVVGPVQTNCYFSKHKETGELVIADPGKPKRRELFMRWKTAGKPAAILFTHGHYDHICAANELREHYGIRFAQRRQRKGCWQIHTAICLQISSGVPYTVKADVPGGQRCFEAGGLQKMLLTPGHTPASLLDRRRGCLVLAVILFFAEAAAEPICREASMSSMRQSLNRLLHLLPQHRNLSDGEATDAEFERKNNPYL